MTTCPYCHQDYDVPEGVIARVERPWLRPPLVHQASSPPAWCTVWGCPPGQRLPVEGDLVLHRCATS